MRHSLPAAMLWLSFHTLALHAAGFEGRIHVSITQGSQTNTLLYTIGPEHLRIEATGGNGLNPINILEGKTGTLTLVFPNNQSFMRLKTTTPAAPAMRPGMAMMPMPPGGLPPGVGPQGEMSAFTSIPTMQMEQSPGPDTLAGPSGRAASNPPSIQLKSDKLPPGLGPQSGNPARWAMFTQMPPMSQGLEFMATGKTTNISGFACQQYVIKQSGETMEVWATDQLPPYLQYITSQAGHFGPRMLEQQWPGLLADRKLFPLLAILSYDSGVERLRFEVTSIHKETVAEPDATLFEPKADYREVEPRPF